MAANVNLTKLVKEVADFHNTFRGLWKNVPNAKADEKLKVTDEVLRMLDNKPRQFVPLLLQGDKDTISRVVSSIVLSRKLLGTHLPHHFHKFIAQVSDHIGERDEDEKGKNYRLDRIQLDLDQLRDLDVAGEVKARASLCATVEQLQRYLAEHGNRVLGLPVSERAGILKLLVHCAKQCCEEEDHVVDLLRFSRRLCASGGNSALHHQCRAFAKWCTQNVQLQELGSKLVKVLEKAVTAATDESKQLRTQVQAAVDDTLRKKLLGTLYTCTSEKDLARLLVQTRQAILAGQVGDYMDRLAIALCRKARTCSKPTAELYKDIHEFVCSLYPKPETTPEEVKSFVDSMPRKEKSVPGGSKRGREEPADPKSAKADKKAQKVPGKAEGSKQAAQTAAGSTNGKKVASNPTRRSATSDPKKKREDPVFSPSAKSVKKLRSLYVTPRKIPKVPAPTEMYWAEGSLDLKKLVKWKLRKQKYDTIFEDL